MKYNKLSMPLAMFADLFKDRCKDILQPFYGKELDANGDDKVAYELVRKERDYVERYIEMKLKKSHGRRDSSSAASRKKVPDDQKKESKAELDKNF